VAIITKAVGRGVTNLSKSEVSDVQSLLNQHRKPWLFRPIRENGVVEEETIAAIEEFQRRVVKMYKPNGRVDPVGTTLRMLCEEPINIQLSSLGVSDGIAEAISKDVGLDIAGGISTISTAKYFSHKDAGRVNLTYLKKKAVKMNITAENLLKSILASCGIMGATLNSTLRTYHDQARITIDQTSPDRVMLWYGSVVYSAYNKYKKTKNISGFAKWWENYDTKRGKVSSKHLSNRAMDVVPAAYRTKFVSKVKSLIPVVGSGVYRIIPKGQMKEPVDHVEFTFDIT